MVQISSHDALYVQGGDKWGAYLGSLLFNNTYVVDNGGDGNNYSNNEIAINDDNIPHPSLLAYLGAEHSCHCRILQLGWHLIVRNMYKSMFARRIEKDEYNGEEEGNVGVNMDNRRGLEWLVLCNIERGGSHDCV
jgi:hypothetical protein